MIPDPAKPAVLPAPAVQLAPSKRFGPQPLENFKLYTEDTLALRAPGSLMRYQGDLDGPAAKSSALPKTGIAYDRQTGTAVATDVPNPDAPDGRWDPYAWMPRFAFAGNEDAFPVNPRFDGDASFTNNGPRDPSGKGNYADGRIGGNQPLSGGFAVTERDGYVVLTYSFYYAHNKAVSYHQNDYSTAQVYLKPGADGKLAPAYLYTSFHHGGTLTPWADLAKDADGRPTVRVFQGSHATVPVGKGQHAPEDGLVIAGDGQASLKGKPLPAQRLAFEAFQGNVANVTRLDPRSPEAGPRLRMMAWGGVGLDPLAPRFVPPAPAPPGFVDKLLAPFKALRSSVPFFKALGSAIWPF